MSLGDVVTRVDARAAILSTPCLTGSSKQLCSHIANTGSVSSGVARFDCRKREQFGEPLRPRWRELGGQGVGLTLALEREGERDFPVDALNPKP